MSATWDDADGVAVSGRGVVEGDGAVALAVPKGVAGVKSSPTRPKEADASATNLFSVLQDCRVDTAQQILFGRL